MALNLKKLSNVSTRAGKTIAQCPACAEDGRDRKGEHLFISDDGRFGCVAHGDDPEHRRRIFAIAGESEQERQISIRRFKTPDSTVIIDLRNYPRFCKRKPG